MPKVPAMGQRSTVRARVVGVRTAASGNQVAPGTSRSIEATRRMGQHGIDLASFRREIGSCHHLSAIVARNLVEQPFEFIDVTIHGLLELAVHAILLADVVECLLTLQGIESAGEHVAFPTLVAVPKVGSGIVVDHASDINGKGIKRLNRMPRRPVLISACGSRLTGALAWQFTLRLAFLARRAAKQIGQPATTGWNWRGCERRRLVAARSKGTGLGPRQRTLLDLIARFVTRRWLAAWRRFVAAADDGKRRLLARPSGRFDRIEVPAVTGDDTIEFGQGLDLVDDNPAHLRGILRRFLRQLKHAAAQLAARCLELALHLRSHLLHALDGFRKPLIGVAEEGFSVGGGLFIKGTHRSSCTLPLFLSIFAHAFILFADRAGALGARF